MALLTYCQFRNKEDMFKSKPYPKVNPGIFFKHLNDKPLTSDSKAVSGFFNQKIGWRPFDAEGICPTEL